MNKSRNFQPVYLISVWFWHRGLLEDGAVLGREEWLVLRMAEASASLGQKILRMQNKILRRKINKKIIFKTNLKILNTKQLKRKFDFLLRLSEKGEGKEKWVVGGRRIENVSTKGYRAFLFLSRAFRVAWLILGSELLVPSLDWNK